LKPSPNDLEKLGMIDWPPDDNEEGRLPPLGMLAELALSGSPRPCRKSATRPGSGPVAAREAAACAHKRGVLRPIKEATTRRYGAAGGGTSSGTWPKRMGKCGRRNLVSYQFERNGFRV